MSQPYRRNTEEQPPKNIGPIRCADCEHWRLGPPLNCVKVDPMATRRSLLVVNKHWTAEESGCADFEAKPQREGWRFLRRLFG